LLLLTLGGMTAGNAAAEVYRWVDANGVVHYTDKPPKRGTRPVSLPPLQLISGEGPPAAPIPEGFPLRMATPSPDSSFGSAHAIEAKVALGRSAPAGAGLLFLLDGNPINTTPQNPQSAPSYRFQGDAQLVEARAILAGVTGMHAIVFRGRVDEHRREIVARAEVLIRRDCL
jgi:hypothetical protein